VVLNPALPIVKVNPGDALKQSFFEALLLPPWANGVIPIFVLFMCWLVEDWAVYKKTDNHGATEMDIWSLKGMMSAWRIFFSAFSVITGLVFFLWFMEFIRISAVLKYLIILPVAADLILFFVALIVGILYLAKRRHLIASFVRDHWNKYSQFATGVFNRLKSRFKRGKRRGKRKPKIIRIPPN
jgi:hypothetical protein